MRISREPIQSMVLDIVKENVDIESVYREVYGDGS